MNRQSSGRLAHRLTNRIRHGLGLRLGGLLLSWLIVPAAGLAQEPAAPSGDDSARWVAALLAEARSSGDAGRGAEVFLDAKFACSSCHKVGGQGGELGPDLTSAGLCLKPEQIVESVLWPKRQVREG